MTTFKFKTGHVETSDVMIEIWDGDRLVLAIGNLSNDVNVAKECNTKDEVMDHVFGEDKERAHA